MLGQQPPKKIRKGAKSCTECRRRKIRCVWLSDEAQVCRRCEERGSECVPQTFSSQTARSDVLSSRDRIARLERQYTSLTQVVNGIQAKLGGVQVQIDSLPEVEADEDDSSASSDDGSIVADPLDDDGPAYLKSLFNNNVISTDNSVDGVDRRRETMSTLLAAAARDNLRRLIPTRQEVINLAPYAKPWIALYQTMFPTYSVPASDAQLVAKYDQIQRLDVNPTALATWLVSIAITAQQIPDDKVATLNTLRQPLHYSKAVSETIEKYIIAHDSLMGTMGGLNMALHYIRLQASRASFKKLWLTLRRVIAIAELIGLPRIAQNYQKTQLRAQTSGIPAPSDEEEGEESTKSKADAWMAICTFDRILGMMCNLPPGTSRYNLVQPDVSNEEPVLFIRVYLRKLADIASKVEDLDDVRMSGGTDDEVCAHVLNIDRDLIALASTAQPAWWDESLPAQLPGAIMPYWHYYIAMRTHLCLALRNDESHRFDYSRFTCMNTCENLLSRYNNIRPKFGGGFFLGRLLNLQAVTASVVLLLTWHSFKSDMGFRFQAQTIGNPKELIAQVLDTMERMSKFKAVDFSRQGVATIQSLIELLDHDGPGQPKQLTLRVPLLGKIHVQRNRNTQRQNTNSGYASPNQQRPYPQGLPQVQVGQQTLPPTSAGMLGYGQNGSVIDGWHFDPFTWVIEDDRESAFRDALSAEDFSYFDSPGDYGSTYLSSDVSSIR